MWWGKEAGGGAGRWEEADKATPAATRGAASRRKRGSAAATRSAFLTADTAQEVYGFEFGNELPKVDPTVMANDFLQLRKLINK